MGVKGNSTTMTGTGEHLGMGEVDIWCSENSLEAMRVTLMKTPGSGRYGA